MGAMRNEEVQGGILVKRLSFWVGLTLVLALFVTGCGGPRKSLTIAGSTSVQPFMEMLAEEFMNRNPGVQINVQGGGSSAGIKAVSDGTADIGMASRELTPSEVSGGVVPVTIARDGIAVIVHPQNVVSGMTIEQLREVFAGRLVSWKALEGGGSVVVVVREEGSGTRSAFDELVMGEQLVTKNAVVQGSTGAVRTAVAGDPNAIGYISLAQVDKTVKAVAIGGVPATEQNIAAGTYKIARPFNVLTKGPAAGLAQTFIDFILSADGKKILAAEGLIVQ